MNFIRHNLESEFLVSDSRLSQPNKEWLRKWSQQYFYVDLLSELGINEEKKVWRYADILTYLKRAWPLSVLATITKLSYDKRTDTVHAKISFLYSLLCWYNPFDLCTGYVSRFVKEVLFYPKNEVMAFPNLNKTRLESAMFMFTLSLRR